MNYFIIKNIVETTLTHFACKECGARATEQDMHILGTAGNSLNMEIICPKCRASGVIKAEMNIMGVNAPLGANTTPTEFVEQMKKKADERRKGEMIKDSDIMKLREDLKNTLSVSDLFNS